MSLWSTEKPKTPGRYWFYNRNFFDLQEPTYVIIGNYGESGLKILYQGEWDNFSDFNGIWHPAESIPDGWKVETIEDRVLELERKVKYMSSAIIGIDWKKEKY